jgi:hypothetical protein
MIFDGPVTEENRMALEAELARQKEIFSRESAESKRAIRQAASMTHWIETFPLPSAALFFGSPLTGPDLLVGSFWFTKLGLTAPFGFARVPSHGSPPSLGAE